MEVAVTNKITKKKRFIQYLYISLGVLIVDIGFYFFLDPAKICIGGTMGLAIIITPFIQNILPWFTNSMFLYSIDVILLGILIELKLSHERNISTLIELKLAGIEIVVNFLQKLKTFLPICVTLSEMLIDSSSQQPLKA